MQKKLKDKKSFTFNCILNQATSNLKEKQKNDFERFI